MTKSIIIFFIALGALLPLASRTQTTVIYKGVTPSEIKLNITRIEWDTLDDYPVKLDINIANGKVTKITLPALDFYEQNTKEETDRLARLP